MRKTTLIFRFLIVLMCLPLCSCILQSPQALFADKEGKPLLQPFGNTFVAYNRESGEWKKQDDIIKFNAEGNHYRVHDKNGDIKILFAQLNEHWWVMQSNETGKPSTYLLVRPEGNALVLHILSCKVLKQNASLRAAISFSGDDCTANANMTKAKFLELTTSPEPALLKIEPLH